MKKKICFAGFPPAELETLKPAMAAMNERWECVFLDDSAAVIDAAGATAFDAVVANMHLRGINGAELLHKVGEVHPATLRFVVGEVSDQELIITGIGGTHQFISRPFTPLELISVIQRSFGLDARLSNEQLRALAPRLRRLPSLPSTYFEVLKQVESANPSMESIGLVIARDPAVTARLLQLVNSAAFALARKVTDPVDAVCLLGIETVKSLVLCLQVFSQSDEAEMGGLSLEQLWNHSFLTAQIAREITLRHTRDSGLANDAFTAGLLHDVGRIVIASNLPKDYAAIVSAAKEKSQPLPEAETARLGVNHAQVGAYLLGLWGMPATLVEAAALHHTPSSGSSTEFSLLTAVHIANVFAHERQGNDDGIPKPQLDDAYLAALNLTDKVAALRQPAAAETSAKTETMKIAATPPPIQEAPPLPFAQRSSGWLIKFSIPAAAAVVALAAFVLWKNVLRPEISVKIRARTPDLPVAAPKPQTPVAEGKPADKPAAKPADAAPTDVRTEPPPPITAVDKLNQGIRLAVAPPSSPNFDSLKVQGIIFGSANPSVIINGKTLFIGERINGFQVVSITESNVTVSSGSEKKIFKLK